MSYFEHFFLLDASGKIHIFLNLEILPGFGKFNAIDIFTFSIRQLLLIPLLCGRPFKLLEYMMPTYSIIGVTVKDSKLFQKYVDGHRDTLAKFGGRFLAAGNEFDVIEGVWPGQIVVVHEWPDRSAFHDWYASDDYRPWKEMRLAAASANVVLIDGLPAEVAGGTD